MAEYNVPYPKNYFIANKAGVWIAEETSAGVYDTWKTVGNVRACTFTPEEEAYIHSSHLFGLNKQDRRITISIGGTVTVEIDEIVRQNMEWLFRTATRTAAQNVAMPEQERVVFSGGVGAVNSGSAIIEVLEVLPLSGEDTYTEGATGDYTVTIGTGTITQTVGTSMSASGTYIVTYTVTHSVNQYTTFDDADKRGKVWVVSSGEAIDVPKKALYIPMAEISMEGDMGLLPKEEAQSATLNLKIVEETTGVFAYWYVW